MKHPRSITYCFFVLMVCVYFIPSAAMALAGIGEHDATFHYNDYTRVSWQHPGQFCVRDAETSDLYCLTFRRDQAEEFKGLEFSLEEINVPVDESTPFIIARRSIDSKWLVYNLEEERHLINEVAYSEALAVWQSLELSEPHFVDSLNPQKLLHETAASRKRTLALKMLPYATLGSGPGIFLFVFLGCRTDTQYRKYKKESQKDRLVLARICLVATAMAGLWVIASIGFWFFM